MTSASRLVVNSVALFVPGNEAINSVTAVPISFPGPYITFFARGGNQEENCLTFFEIVESVAV